LWNHEFNSAFTGPKQTFYIAGTDEEIGTHTYDHVTQNKMRESHQRFWHKPLKNVDKMLFSTDCSETPMIINTILLLDGVINITQLRIFLRKLADLHPRMRMCIVNGKWEVSSENLKLSTKFLPLTNFAPFHLTPYFIAG